MIQKVDQKSRSTLGNIKQSSSNKNSSRKIIKGQQCVQRMESHFSLEELKVGGSGRVE